MLTVTDRRDRHAGSTASSHAQPKTPSRRPKREDRLLTAEERRRVEKNLPLVEHIVNRMAARFPANYCRDDLTQTGTIGLIEAATRFDENLGVAFSTFAGRRIEGAIIDMLRRDDWAPRSVRSLERRIERVQQALASAGRRPDDEELSDAVGIRPDQLHRFRSDLNRASLDSLDRRVNVVEGDQSLADTLVDVDDVAHDDELGRRELRSFLRDAISMLSERQRMVVVGYFFEGRSMTELGEFLGVTQSRASQIKEEALVTMRSAVAAYFEEGAAPPVSLRERRQAAYNDAVAKATPCLDRLSDESLEVLINAFAAG